MPKFLTSSALKLWLCVLVFDSAFVGWHYFLSTPGEFARECHDMYLYHDPVSRKGVAGYFDLMLPSILFGLIAGMIGARESPTWVKVNVVLLATTIVALHPVYVHWLPESEIWWLQRMRAGPLRGYGLQLIKAVAVTGVSAYGGFLQGQMNLPGRRRRVRITDY